MSTPPIRLLQYQADLVRQLVESDGVRIALVAPPGTGKTRAVITAIGELISRDESATVLVIAPAAVGSYVADALSRLDAPPRVRHLRGADLRKHQEKAAALEAGVYVVSVVVAREPWAREVIEAQPWSLVFFDEATYGGVAVTELVEELAVSPTTSRLCAASSTGWKEVPAGLELITWSIDATHRRRRRAELVLFERHPAELEVRERLSEIEAQLGANRGVRASLDSAWRSSASAFEYVLAREAAQLEGVDQALSSREKLALLDSPGEQLVFAKVAESRAESISRARWVDPVGARAALKELLGRIGEIDRDSKLEAFQRHVRNRSAASRILVFTAMRQTAAYLGAALEADELQVAVIDGSRAQGDRTSLADARVVVVTDAVVPALDLEDAYEGCSYDLPWAPKVLEARWANLGEVAGDEVMYIVVDRSQSDSAEREILRRHALINEKLAFVRQTFGDAQLLDDAPDLSQPS